MTMQRSKWYRLSTALSLSGISDRIRAYTYEESDAFGFGLTSSRESRIAVRYSEKFIHIDQFQNAFGEEVISQTTRYKIVNFSISQIGDGKYILHIENSPRSTIDFFANLEKSLGEDLSIALISYNILEFLNSLTNSNAITQLKIKKAVFSGMAISTKSRAKVEVVSSQNAISDFERKFGNSYYTIDTISCHFRHQGREVSMELRKSGTISHSKLFLQTLHEEVLKIIV